VLGLLFGQSDFKLRLLTQLVDGIEIVFFHPLASRLQPFRFFGELSHLSVHVLATEIGNRTSKE
jgi:hypothetical protein